MLNRAELMRELASLLVSQLEFPRHTADGAASAIVRHLERDTLRGLQRQAWQRVTGRLARRAAVLRALDPQLARELSETAEHYRRTLGLSPKGESASAVDTSTDKGETSRF